MSGRLRSWFRVCRLGFRCVRIALLGALLLLSLLFGYLHLVGLPEFLKARVRADLLEKGVKIDFERLHLRAFRHVLLEGASLQMADGGEGRGTKVTIPQAELVFDPEALKSFSLKIKGLAVVKANVRLSLGPGEGDDELAVDDIYGELVLPGPDEWRLERLKANLLGVRLLVSATIIQPDRFFADSKTGRTNAGPSTDWRKILTDIQRRFERIKVAGEPVVLLSGALDGRTQELVDFSAKTRLESIEEGSMSAQDVYVDLSGRAALTGGGASYLKARLRANRFLEGTNLIQQPSLDLAGSGRLEGFKLDEADVAVKIGALNGWGLLAGKAEAGGRFRLDEAGNVLLSGSVDAKSASRGADSLGHTTVDWGATTAGGLPQALLLAHEWMQGRTPTNGWAARLSVKGESAQANGLSAERFSIGLEGSPGDAAGTATNLMAVLRSLNLSGAIEASGLAGRNLNLPKAALRADWRGGILQITNLDLQLPNGKLAGSASYGVEDSRLRFAFSGNPRFTDWLPAFNLSDKQLALIDRVKLRGDPSIRCEGSFRLKQAEGRWSFDQPLLRGEATFPSAEVFGIGMEGLRVRGGLSGREAVLDELSIERAEGAFTTSGKADLDTAEFRLDLDSRIDPTCLAPLLQGAALKNLLWLRFPVPPHVAGVLAGSWDRPQDLRFDGAFQLTNTYYRQKRLDSVHANILYTNQNLILTDALLSRAGQTVQAPWLKLVPSEQVLYVTNGLSRIDPYLFTGLIGEHVLGAINPYRFNKVPEVIVNGRIPLADADEADIRFQVKGEDFSWWRFRIPKVDAEILWKGDSLVVTNVSARFYGGHLDWHGAFKFRPGQGEADYRFTGIATNVNLADALADIAPMTNRLTGEVHGQLIIDKADTTSILSWQGRGDAVLRDGFLWSVPVFGIASPMLNTLSPGLGESKVSEGTTTFTVSDGKFHTRDMVLRSPSLRLRYEGSVDFDANLDARMEALFFRDANLFAKAFGVALTPLSKATESRITGTLAEPKTSLMHIPRWLLIPLHPVQSIRDFFTQEKPSPPRRPASE